MIRDGLVRLETRGPVAIITLNRPDVLNAVNAALTDELSGILDVVEGDAVLRVGVITGAGRAFCAGQDITALRDGEAVGADSPSGDGFAGIVRRVFDKPLIAAVNGLAFGGGLEIALACDMIVMAATATIALPEVRLGLIAAGGGIPRIGHDLPPKVAAKLVYTGEPMDAADAYRWGLVGDLVPTERVLERALDLAERVAANAPLAIGASKRILRLSRSDSDGSERTSELVAREFAALRVSKDAREGARAFVEKRAPRWICE